MPILNTHERELLLAEKVRTYWLDRGYVVETRIETVSTGNGTLFCLRSNLVRGRPQ
jgi:hypothetical protein